VHRIIHWGRAKIEGLKTESGDGVLGEGQQPPANQLGGWESVVSSPAGFGAEPRPPKGVPVFSALRVHGLS